MSQTSDTRVDQLVELREELDDRSDESEATPAMGENLSLRSSKSPCRL